MENKLKIQWIITGLVATIILCSNVFVAFKVDLLPYILFSLLSLTIGVILAAIIWFWGTWGAVEDKPRMVTAFKILVAMPGTAGREVLVRRNLTHVKGITQSIVFNTGETIPVTATMVDYYAELSNYTQTTGIAEFKLTQAVSQPDLPEAILTAAALPEGDDKRMELVYQA